MEFPDFLFVPIVSCPVPGHLWGGSASIFFTSPMRCLYLIHTNKVTPETLLLQAEPFQLSQPDLIGEMLQSFPEHLWFCSGLTPVCLYLSFTEEPRSGHQIPDAVISRCHSSPSSVLSVTSCDPTQLPKALTWQMQVNAQQTIKSTK